jgi:dTDP-4-dehydrorhamnose reductase
MLGHKMVQAFAAASDDTWCTLRGRRDDPLLTPVPFLQSPDRVIEGIDAAHGENVIAVIRRLTPDVVVNCVGVIKQRKDAKAALPSIAVNSLLPHVIATALEEWGGRLIHFSTDCVFDGRRGNYCEDDRADADDLYGRTKYLGEVATANALTLRTSIIGRELSKHASLLDWFLSQRGKTIRGFRCVWWSGVTTNHLADLVVKLACTRADLSGLYQVSSGRIDKYELLCLLRDAYSLDVVIEPEETTVLDRSLSGARFEAATGYRFPTWPLLLEQLVNDPTPYPTLAV